MKVLVQPSFNLKIPTFTDSSISKLALFIGDAERLTIDELINKGNLALLKLADDFYTVEIDGGRLYFTIGEENGEEYLLLLDFSQIKKDLISVDEDFSHRKILKKIVI